MNNLVTSLWITLIGMGLVFIALLMLWGLMNLMVGLIKDKPEEETGAEEQPQDEPAAEESQPVLADRSLKQRAAAAAVAVALAQTSSARSASAESTAELYPTPVSGVSAWQSVLRAGQYNRRSHLKKS